MSLLINQDLCIIKWLTLGPGGPTLPAAPGKPVAPWNKEYQVNFKSKTYTINPLIQINSSIEHDN